MNSQHQRLARPEAPTLYRLRSLGCLTLEDAPDAADGAATRPRSLALLALLAAAGSTGVPRNKLLLYLWPESNTQRARNSLHQTLYALRRHLGQEAVLAGIPNLQLNPRVFSCDLWDFEAALSRGATEEAIALYSGPFLDGFALPGLPEFEHWVEEERVRLARRYEDALENSAAEATRRGHYRLAVERWQALARLDPLSTRPALGVMRAFMAAGNGAGALAYARDYVERLRRELGAEPDPAITALVEQLRAKASPEAVVHTTSEAPPAGAEATTPFQAEPRGVRSFSSRRWKLAIVLLLFVDVVAVAGWLLSRGGPRPPASPSLLAVFPFTVEGGPDVQYLGTGLVDLLTTNLEGAGDIRGVDPRALLGQLSHEDLVVRTPEEAATVAGRFGAGLFLLGNVVESGGRLRLQAAMYDRRRTHTPLARAAVEGHATDLFALVDRLTAELLAEARQDPHERLARVAATTTGSLDALKQYLAGERELRAGRYVPALEAFRAATALDTAFALAHYRLSIAAEWAAQDSLARSAAASAVRLDSRLSEHDRLLVRALDARRAGRLGEAERLYRDVVDHYPDDVEAWLQLGQLIFQINPLRGRSSSQSRPMFERVVELDPGNEEALVHLARIASIEGRRAGIDSVMQRLLALGPTAEVLETRAFRAFALGDRDAWKRVTRELLRNPPEVPPVTALQVATYLDDLDGAESFARLLRDRQYSDDVRGMAYRLLARVAVARGQWSVARTNLDSAASLDHIAALELRSLLAVLPFLELPQAELLEIRRDVERWPAGHERPGEVSHSAAHAGLHPYIRQYRLGLLSTRLGDTVKAGKHAVALDQAGDSASALKSDVLHTFARSIRARIAGHGGRAAEALEHLDQADWQMVESLFEAEALDRYYRAELLEAIGREAEAVDWYRTIAERATYELVYVAPARWRQGRIYERQGDRARAVESYRTVTRLLREADPVFRPILADATERLRALDATSPDTTRR